MSSTESITMDTTTTPAVRYRTVGRTLLAAGPSDERPGLLGARHGDGSWWVELHAFGRYAGVYR